MHAMYASFVRKHIIRLFSAALYLCLIGFVLLIGKKQTDIENTQFDWQPHEHGSFKSRSINHNNTLIDCKKLVPFPNDSAPVRSPQEVHSVIAAKVINKRLVEIGTRNGDGMACFAHVASSVSAVEYEREYCAKLTERSKRAGVRFEVQCLDFLQADLDADFITWWQQVPLTNAAALAKLKQDSCSGRVRSNAEAILIFDTSWPRDLEDLNKYEHFFSWQERVQFDERTACERSTINAKERKDESGFSCRRSQGTFVTAGLLISNIPDSIARCMESDSAS